MKKRTIYTLPKDTDPDDGAILYNLIHQHETEDHPIFERLESYIDDEPIMDRVAPNDLLTVNNFAQYITSVTVGYMLGNPVDYVTSDKVNLDPIINNYSEQSVSDLDLELAEDCSIFGQAFENIYVDEDSTTLSAKLSVYNTIVVYDDTFKHNKMFAIYYAPELDNNGRAKSGQYDVTIWTPTHVLHRKLVNKASTETDEPDQEHYYGDVPVVHYMNNKRMKGDFEPVITLIDAYNILQSDRVLDREKLVDAILAFNGARMTSEDMEQLKTERVLGLPEGASAEYIVKQLDEQGADVLRKTLASDIHKFSMTPDLSDETFGNSPSGVSILYKLLAFEQNVKKKERMFETALKKRFALYNEFLLKGSRLNKKIDLKTLDVVFKHAMPRNDLETSQMITNLEGLVSSETLISPLSFVNDASAEVEKAKAERVDSTNFATDQAG